jgi:hypothetical protein
MTFASTGTGVPPDTQVAVGPGNVLEAVNTNIAIYNKTGAVLSSQSLSSLFTSLHPRTLTDPAVGYDEQANRFVIGVLDVDTGSAPTDPGRIDFAVSNTSDPTGGFTELHSVSVTETAASGANAGKRLWGDFLRFGWNTDAYVFNVNMFTSPITSASVFDHVQVVTVAKPSVIDANNATLTGNHVDRAGAASTLAPAAMHNSRPGDPLWFVQEDATASGMPTGTSLRLVRMDGVLTATPTFTDYVLPVSAYSFNADTSTPPASQKGSTATIATNDTRILSVAWRRFTDAFGAVTGERLIAAQGVGTTAAGASVARARWYDFRTDSSAPSGSALPALTQSGQINPVISGTGGATYFPSVELTSSGTIGMTFMESSSNEFMSMYAAGQKAGDPAGVIQTGVLVKAGAAAYNASGAGDKSPYRAGDYSGIGVDPVTGNFWVANEYAAPRSGFLSYFANWGTWVATFSVPSNATTSVNTALLAGGAPSGPTTTAPGARALAAGHVSGAGGSAPGPYHIEGAVDDVLASPDALAFAFVVSPTRRKRSDMLEALADANAAGDPLAPDLK